jgi:excisionase family DNA binding protein
MAEKYYTVEQIAGLLNMHPKTIQRYIREGKLRASKIGKGWRVTGHDLSVFTESVKIIGQSEKVPAQDRIKASSVVDIQVDDKEDAIRIINALTAALNSKPPEYGGASMHAQFIEAEGKVRVTLWGGMRFMETMFGAIGMLTDQPEQEA